MKGKLLDRSDVKCFRSEHYNYNYDKASGYFMRWGKTSEDDPQFSPFGPEIWDCEVTTICGGISKQGPCRFCYKGNTPIGMNMSFDTFKRTFNKFPKVLTQIAFGADAKCESNPDLWKMMEYAHLNGIVPNITVAEISDDVADNLAKYCGAVAVSYYDKDTCFDSIKKLTDRGMKRKIKFRRKKD